MNERGLPSSRVIDPLAGAQGIWAGPELHSSQWGWAVENHAHAKPWAWRPALRKIAVGRRDWLFFGSDGGGATAAVLASFTETCQRHAINPWTYLADVLTRLPSHLVEQLADFLPVRWAGAHVAAGYIGRCRTAGRDPTSVFWLRFARKRLVRQHRVAFERLDDCGCLIPSCSFG